MSSPLHAAAVALLLSLPLSAQAEIYRCVDGSGKVHYAQSKLPGVTCTTQAPAAERSGYSGGAASMAEFAAELDQERSQAEQRQQEAQEQKDQQQARCSRARKRLAYLETGGGPLYRIDDKGERTYLSTQEIDQTFAEARQLVARECR